MANRYCNLDGTKKIREEYLKINNGFQSVQEDIDNKNNTLQNQITINLSKYNAHKDGTNDKHKLSDIQNDSSQPGANAAAALNAVAAAVQQIEAGDSNAAIGTYSINAFGTDAYTATYAGLSYFAGLKINATIQSTNTGAATLNINSAGAKSIKKMDAFGNKVDVDGGDLLKGNIAQLEYDGVDFILLNAQAPSYSDITITGGIGSLPSTAVNSPVSVTVKGRTVKQELSYNRDTWEGWSQLHIELFDLKVENQSIVFTGSSEYKYCEIEVPAFKSGNKFGVLFYVSKNTTVGGIKAVGLFDNINGIYVSDQVAVYNNGWNKGILNVTEDGNSFRIFINSDVTSGEIAFKDVQLYKLTSGSKIESDFETMTADELAQKYSYIQGGTPKSTICSGRIKTVGKNLIDIKSFIKGDKNVTFIIDGDSIILNRNNAPTNRMIYTNFDIKAQITASVRAVSGVSSLAPIRFAFLDENLTVKITSNYFNKLGQHSQSFDLSNRQDIKYFGILIDAYNTEIKIADLQIELGTVATSYEPYKESNTYVVAKDPQTEEILEARSLPNGTKDEFRVSEGKLIQRIGHKENVASGTVINYTDMADGGVFYAWNDDGETQAGVKGDTLTIDATQLIYQLAVPIETQTIPQQIIAGAGSTIMWLPHVKETKIYDGGITVTDTTLPIKSLVSVFKIDSATGEQTEIDTDTCTIAGDGLSFTSTELEDGDSVIFVYEYDTSLSTVPTIVVRYANNFKAQTENNTKAIQQNSKAIITIEDRLDLMYADLDFRITLLGGV